MKAAEHSLAPAAQGASVSATHAGVENLCCVRARLTAVGRPWDCGHRHDEARVSR
jgi:hypothetical protein